MMSEPLKIAIAGLGTVGAGAVKLIHDQSDVLAARAGRPIVVTAVSARDRNKDRGINLDRIQWFDDADEMASQADADAVVELIGGSEGIARAVCETALGKARHVVAIMPHNEIKNASGGGVYTLPYAVPSLGTNGTEIKLHWSEDVAGKAYVTVRTDTSW